VGADGAKSTIARQFNLGRNHNYLLGVENEVAWHDAIDPNFLHVFLDPILAPGYIGWIVPGVNALQVGLATRYPNKPALKHFMRKLGAHFAIDWQVLGQRGGLIPCGGVVSPLARGRVCLLGDAAGMVSPLTAGGIHPAIEIGEALGEAVADYLQADGKPPHHQLRSQLPAYRVKRNLRRLFDTFTPPTAVYNHMIGHPFFKRIAQIIFFHHRGLFCKEAWRDILRGENI
jgi:flavin-dependent dehydrogenase